MEKVLFICASPRKNGNTAEVLSECAEIIENHGLRLLKQFIYVGKILSHARHVGHVLNSIDAI